MFACGVILAFTLARVLLGILAALALAVFPIVHALQQALHVGRRRVQDELQHMYCAMPQSMNRHNSHHVHHPQLLYAVTAGKSSQKWPAGDTDALLINPRKSNADFPQLQC
jgi:hypothetical protein